MPNREIRVRPTDWVNSPDEESFPLSDMDHTMPKIFVQIVEIFELPVGTDKEPIIESLIKGLEFTLSQFPVLAGALHMDENTGRMWVTKSKDSTVTLHVKSMDEGEHDFPSFAQLSEKDFPIHVLDGHLLLPKSVTEKQLFSPLGENTDEELFISTFQINFIKGGLILSTAIHHSCSDGPGCNGFLTTWAENSAASMKGMAFRPIDKSNRDRSRLSAPPPDASRWKTLDGKFPILKDLGGPPPAPPADFKMPPLKIRLWHFSKSSADRLKADAKLTGNGDAWVSTYDAIMALLWKTITRAKIPLLQPSLDDEVVLVHAVNTRKRLEPPLPDRFLGNAVALPRVNPRQIKDIVDGGNLPQLASAVRESIKSITSEYVAELPEWVAGLEDRRWISIAMSSFLGMDLAGTSWQAMTPYEEHDFGFGLPKAIRWPHPQFEGYVFVLPSRANVKKDSLDEGFEVCICLEESCHDRLLKDEDLLKYARPRGTEE